MAINLIQGEMLEGNLTRDGVNLTVETDLLFLDVVNGRVGINKTPTAEFDAGTALIAGLTFNTNEITAATTVLKLTSTDGILITGDLDFAGTDSLLTPPTYTTALLPGTPTEGGMVYDSSSKQIKFYDGTQWSDIASTEGLSVYVIKAATTDATQTEALVGGAGGTQLILPANTTWRFEANIVARRTGGTEGTGVVGDSSGYKFTGVIHREATAGTTSIVGFVAEVIDAEDVPAWAVTVDADATNGALRVQVTGTALENISWVAFIRTVEVTG